MDALSSLGQILFCLYRLTKETNPSQFQDKALELVRTYVPFDASAWPTGVLTHGEVIPHTVHLNGFPDGFLQSWQAYKHEDHLIQQVMTNPGTTFNVCVQDEFSGTEILEKHCKPNRMEQILCTSEVEPLTGLYNVIGIYRNSATARFSEEERGLLQLLTPHLCETWKSIRIDNFKQTISPDRQAPASFAIADSKGILHVTDHRFAPALRLEWPDWNGASLPEEILQMSASLGSYRGKNIVVTCQATDDFILLVARNKTALDSLSQREMQIARSFTEGRSYKEIAAVLDISPATVRTHISTIYLKAQVNSKIELAGMFRDYSV